MALFSKVQKIRDATHNLGEFNKNNSRSNIFLPLQYVSIY